MVRRWSDRKRLIKLRGREYKRRRAVSELVEQHAKFVGVIDVLDELWRRELSMTEESLRILEEETSE